MTVIFRSQATSAAFSKSILEEEEADSGNVEKLLFSLGSNSPKCLSAVCFGRSVSWETAACVRHRNPHGSRPL